MANLIVEQTPVKGFRSFQRRLDMEHAVSQQWTDGGIQIRREVFVFRAVDMVIYHLCAEAADVERELLKYTLNLNAFRNEREWITEEIQAIWDAARSEVVCEDVHTGYFNSQREKTAGIVGRRCLTNVLSQTEIANKLPFGKKNVFQAILELLQKPMFQKES